MSDGRRLQHRYSELPKEPKDQDDHKDEAQNAARPAGPISTVAVSAAAEENDKQRNDENYCHGRMPLIVEVCRKGSTFVDQRASQAFKFANRWRFRPHAVDSRSSLFLPLATIRIIQAGNGR
jgi:hypothetical protein